MCLYGNRFRILAQSRLNHFQIFSPDTVNINLVNCFYFLHLFFLTSSQVASVNFAGFDWLILLREVQYEMYYDDVRILLWEKVLEKSRLLMLMKGSFLKLLNIST